MADTPATIEPGTTVTFVVTKTPPRSPQRKTLTRLMCQNVDRRRDLKKVQRRRRQKDNIATRRSGRVWVNRAKAVRTVHVLPGERFTITVTPQIVPDLRSVEKFLKVETAA